MARWIHSNSIKPEHLLLPEAYTKRSLSHDHALASASEIRSFRYSRLPEFATSSSRRQRRYRLPIMSQAALNKIAPNSPSRAKPNEIEVSIATALHELETNIPDMKAALRPLQFVSAREVR